MQYKVFQAKCNDLKNQELIKNCPEKVKNYPEKNLPKIKKFLPRKENLLSTYFINWSQTLIENPLFSFVEL